ncbi:hypothetical protein lerEdw1_018600 [Lerista edwardsae]|nr:hypothetical protein lerEdw1_018600 [Lerista edwardsae]
MLPLSRYSVHSNALGSLNWVLSSAPHSLQQQILCWKEICPVIKNSTSSFFTVCNWKGGRDRVFITKVKILITLADGFSPEMRLLIILLPLVSVLQHSLGQNEESEALEIPENQKKEIVDKHNAIRRGVTPTASNMQKMVWSEKASQSAKKWATKCKPGTSPKEERTVKGVYCGENSVESGFPWAWPAAIDMWASAKSNFVYGIGALNPSQGIDVYTQLIWHNTFEVGCAVARCQTKDKIPFYYQVCHYCPGGNKTPEMKRPYKEGKPCGDCPKNCDDKLCSKFLMTS